MRLMRLASGILWVATSAPRPSSVITRRNSAWTCPAVPGRGCPWVHPPAAAAAGWQKPGKWRRAAARRPTARQGGAQRARQGRAVPEDRARACAPQACRTGDQLRHHHILERRKFRQQMMELIDKSNADTTDAGAGGIIEGSTILSGHEHLARRRSFEKARNMEQRRLPRARLPDERHDLPGMNLEAGSRKTSSRPVPRRRSARHGAVQAA